MNEENSNPYRTPESDVDVVDLDNRIKNFERFSAWWVFGLTIITLGIYPIYWLYTRSNTVNSLRKKKISSVLLVSLVVFTIGSFISEVFEPTGGEGLLMAIYAAVNIIYVVLYLIVLFKLRNRLNEIVKDNINPILTFFLSAIYLQYAVNRCLDKA